MFCIKKIARALFGWVLVIGLLSCAAAPAKAQFVGGYGWGYGGVGFAPWGFGGYGYGWGMGYPVFATPVFGGYGWGYGVPFWGVPVTFTGYPYGGYSWPYAYDGGWTLASGIGPMAVEAAVIERGLRGVLPQGQRLTPGRYKMTISIEPTSDGRSDTPQK